MNKIHVYYTKFNQQLPGYLLNQYLTQLPNNLQEKNLRYRRWQDQHSHLFGKLLLLNGLKNFGYKDDVLHEIRYNQYSRPFIDGDIDFNISHSGEYVICVLGKGIRLGVDIEEIKEINFDDFKQVMTSGQWQDIMDSPYSMRSFFWYWTIKESVIKADSRGLSIPLLDIHVQGNKVYYDNQIWYLKDLELDIRYSAFLAINRSDVTFETRYIDFYKLNDWKSKVGKKLRD